MLNLRKEFLAGLILATIATAAATHITTSYAVERKYSTEVEFSQRIGLFDSELLSEKTLQSNIAEIAFYRGLNLILVDKGIVKSFNPDYLEPLGITNTTAPMSSITRQKATETILRALIYAHNNGQIDVRKNMKCDFFKDYVPEEKYQNIMAFAIENKVVKGTGNNVFKPNKKLTVREALRFLRNLYELDVRKVASNTFEKPVEEKKTVNTNTKTKTKTIYIEPDLKKFFKDISPTNTMADTVKKLINAGAFDMTDLDHELSLPRSFNVSDYSLICKGMLSKLGKTDLIKRIETQENVVFPDDAVTRDMAVKMGVVLLEAFPHKTYDIKVPYKDVPSKSAVGLALKEMANAGIKLGYPDGSFKGDERISRYEALNLLGIIVGENVSPKIKIQTIEEVDEPAEKDKEEIVVTPMIKKQLNVTDKINAKKNLYKDSKLASKLEQQLSKEYEGLSFLERIEMRKNQFRKILNKEIAK